MIMDESEARADDLEEKDAPKRPNLKKITATVP
jgi:hypothetical protein